ncbi:molybdenum transport system permease protein ModB [Vibrio maritimus]|uniref:Molybdenum transport system permease protein ModB n=1 Tax=Vibrio maritimus TaxID=990268 RepID=A0A090RS77_9VIBR|nr:molybdenum transport system permease protein ModB [Vibrio maritimus]
MLTEYEVEAIFLSLKVASVAIIWLIPIGVFLAWLLSKKDFVGKSLLDSVVHLPLVLPPVVVGYLLLISMGRQGFIGQFIYQYTGMSFSFSWRGAVLACIIVALPLMVRSIRLSMENVDFKLEQAARTLGASPQKVFWTITLPLIIPGIISGTMLSFARSLVNLEQPLALSPIFQERRRLFLWLCIVFSKRQGQNLLRFACVSFQLLFHWRPSISLRRLIAGWGVV